MSALATCASIAMQDALRMLNQPWVVGWLRVCRFIQEELLQGDPAAVDDCKRKMDDIRTCVLSLPSLPSSFSALRGGLIVRACRAQQAEGGRI
jgi:hypothetical protein